MAVWSVDFLLGCVESHVGWHANCGVPPVQIVSEFLLDGVINILQYTVAEFLPWLSVLASTSSTSAHWDALPRSVH